MQLSKAWASGWKKPDRRPIYTWAREFVYLPRGVLTVSGYFDPDRSRHFLEIFDVLQDDCTTYVTLLKPVRQGGSLIGDIWLPWIVANDPGPALVTMQEDNIAKAYAETRTNKLFPLCRPVAEQFPTNKNHKRTMEILFANGMPLWIQGCAPSGLQSRGIRYEINDEVWLWPPGRLEEAHGRLGDYEEIGLAKCFDVSQAGVDGDELDVAHRKGDCREWLVECAGCRRYFIPVSYGFRDDGSRYGLTWDINDETKSKDGLWNIARIGQSLRYECPHCRHHHHNQDEDRTKAAWNLTGRYQPTNPSPEPGHASFHWYGTIGRAWKKLAAQLAGAENALKLGITTPLQVYVQKRDARSWTPDIIAEFSPGRRVTYEINSDWAEESFRLLTADKQKEGVYYVVVRAWSKAGKSRRLYWGKAFGRAEIEKLQKQFNVRPEKVLIDAGYGAKGRDGVYAMCAENGWVAVRGDPKRESYTHTYRGKNGSVAYIEKSYSPQFWGDPEDGTAREGVRLAKLIWFAEAKMNERLENLRKTDFWMVPKTPDNPALEKEYEKQIAAEYAQTIRDPVTGRTITRFVCPSGNNHARDCEKMQVFGATVLGALPDALEVLEQTTVGADQPDPETAQDD